VPTSRRRTEKGGAKSGAEVFQRRIDDQNPHVGRRVGAPAASDHYTGPNGRHHRPGYRTGLGRRCSRRVVTQTFGRRARRNPPNHAGVVMCPVARWRSMTVVRSDSRRYCQSFGHAASAYMTSHERNLIRKTNFCGSTCRSNLDFLLQQHGPPNNRAAHQSARWQTASGFSGLHQTITPKISVKNYSFFNGICISVRSGYSDLSGMANRASYQIQSVPESQCQHFSIQRHPSYRPLHC
jgi:hypothetical protein